jgi:chitodextrinase
LKGKQVTLSWSAATDNVAVAGYHILTNGAPTGTTTSRSWAVTGLSAGVTYTFSVIAYDAAGNFSAPSNSVIVKLGGKGR